MAGLPAKNQWFIKSLMKCEQYHAMVVLFNVIRTGFTGLGFIRFHDLWMFLDRYNMFLE